MTDNAKSNEQEQKRPIFDIARIYNKDISLEVPNAPEVFKTLDKWTPEVKLDLDLKSEDLGENFYESTLRITVTVTNEEKVAFLCEVSQSAIVHVENIPLEQALNIIAPTFTFPYAREVISSLVNKASFPPLNLAPINFEALYIQRKQQEEAAKAEEKA